MKTFLTTTALALTLGGAAIAQGADGYITTASESELMASDLLGATVHATEVEGEITYSAGMESEWDNIGEINDVIIAPNGQVAGVVLGVGGFLGMGEKSVALPMDQLRFVEGEDRETPFIVVNATAETLEQAPAFTMDGNEQQADASSTEMQAETTAEVDASAEIEQETQQAADAIEQTGDDIAAGAAQLAADAEATGEAALQEIEQTADATGEAIAQESQELAAETEAAGQEVMEETQQAADATSDAVTETTAEMSAEADAETFVAVTAQDITVEELNGASVFTEQDENIGEIGDLVMEGETVSEAIISFGGFLGLGQRDVAVPMDQLSLMMSEEGGELRVYVQATEEELEAMPEYEAPAE
ncbi:PRC-barrel domain-containing protein [Pontivivens ytuae]|uniref:PRC-barrel domain-containing protein n=1 Tax=Pontivivens ytuae TaxID=2789856 RepID=A0A7S9LNJ5_9RHOB|nr:PRC-barrel domain-containing protein [Pontivivens ytuae]QPH52302.1 PRC-barrel domain-containing protein [Pontivivens ytuae]